MANDTSSSNLLFEASNPHIAKDEGQKFLEGQARLDRIRVMILFLNFACFNIYALFDSLFLYMLSPSI